MNNKKGEETKNKIIKGLDLAYEKLLAYKKANNQFIVIKQGDKIVKIKP